MNNLSIYIHWPFCKAKCPYCDFNSHVRDKVNEDDFSRAYLKEIDFFKQHISGRKISTIFFGGGTPSLMPPSLVNDIINHLSKITELAEDIEITLEANPTSIESSKFIDFKAAGINRVSIGIQSLKNEALKFLGREHSADEALKALGIAQKIFDNYSFDLIYARPNQSIKDWEEELKTALEFAGNHLSLYQLTIERGTKFYSEHKKNKFIMPGEVLTAALYQQTKLITNQYGYNDYEVSNYAKAGFESKHNLAYWHYQDYLGIGPGAHSRINKQAIMMIHNPEKWLQKVSEENNGIQTQTDLNSSEIFNETLLMGLRITSGVDKSNLFRLLGKKLDQLIDQKKLQTLKDEGLITENETHLKATDKGRMVLNKVIEYLC